MPLITEYISVPSGAAISIPEWLDELPVVGDFRGPKGEVIVWKPGRGQKKSWFEKKKSEDIVDDETKFVE